MQEAKPIVQVVVTKTKAGGIKFAHMSEKATEVVYIAHDKANAMANFLSVMERLEPFSMEVGQARSGGV